MKSIITVLHNKLINVSATWNCLVRISKFDLSYMFSDRFDQQVIQLSIVFAINW